MKIKKEKILFIVLSLFGITIFFVPILCGQIPIIYLIYFVKDKLNNFSQIIVLGFTITLLLSVVLGKIFKIKCFERRHKKDHPIEIVSYVFSFIIQLLICLDIEWEFVQNENIGGQVFSLAYSILITVTVSGFFVLFIVKSGVVEFIACLVQPLMRKVFKLPGIAAIDWLSSFVSSAAVGIYITNSFYEDKMYTEREACSISTCFSVMSLGFMVVMADMAGISQLTVPVIVWSFIIIAVLAIICVRIPPLSKKKEVYIDGEIGKLEYSCINISIKERLILALKEGVKKAGLFEIKFILEYLVDSLLFAQKIIVVMIPLMIGVMCLVTYTPIFEWFGKIFTPILMLCGLPNASEIAPATIIGIAEVTLPIFYIMNLEIETISVFFVVVLSIVQVIFFTESANAILSSSIPLKFSELVIIFLVRTIIAIPLVAVAAHTLLFFGV